MSPRKVAIVLAAAFAVTAVAAPAHASEPTGQPAGSDGAAHRPYIPNLVLAGRPYLPN